MVLLYSFLYLWFGVIQPFTYHLKKKNFFYYLIILKVSLLMCAKNKCIFK